MTTVPGRPPNVSGRPRSSEAVTLPESATWPAWANGHRGRAMQLDWNDAPASATPLATAYRSNPRPEFRRAPATPWARLAWRCITDEIAFFVLGRLPLKYYLEARRSGLTRETRERVFLHFGFRDRFLRRST